MKILTPPLVWLILTALAIISISAAAFGGTFAWFIHEAEKLVEGDEESGLTGLVALDSEAPEIINDGDIPIIVRVRVIAEPVGNSIPDGKTDDEYYDLLNPYYDDNWVKVRGNGVKDKSTDGIYLIYSNKLSKPVDFCDYFKVAPAESFILPHIVIPGYKLTFIVEALQATQKAYDYAWALKPKEGGG